MQKNSISIISFDNNFDFNKKILMQKNIYKIEILQINTTNHPTTNSTNFPRNISIVYIDGSKNVSKALSFAIKTATYSLIKIIDEDIIINENFISEQINKINLVSERTFISSKPLIAQKNNNKHFSHVFEKPSLLFGEEIRSLWSKIPFNFIGCLSQIIFTKNNFSEIGDDILWNNNRYFTHSLSEILLFNLFNKNNVYIDLSSNIFTHKNAELQASPNKNQIIELKKYFKKNILKIDSSIDIKNHQNGSIQKISYTSYIRDIENQNFLIKNIDKKISQNIKLKIIAEWRNSKQKKIAVISATKANSLLSKDYLLTEIFDQVSLDEINLTPNSWSWVISIDDVFEIIEDGLWEIVETLSNNTKINAIYSDYYQSSQTEIIHAIHLPTAYLDMLLSNPNVFTKIVITTPYKFLLAKNKNNSIPSINFHILIEEILESGLGSIGHITNPSFVLREKSPEDFTQHLNQYLSQRGFLNSLVKKNHLENYSITYDTSIQHDCAIILIQHGDPFELLTSLKSLISYSTNRDEIFVCYKKENFETISKIKESTSDLIKFIPQEEKIQDTLKKTIKSIKTEFIAIVSSHIEIQSKINLFVLKDEISRPEVGCASIKTIDKNGLISSMPTILGFGDKLFNSIYDQQVQNQHIYLDRLNTTQNFSQLNPDLFSIKRELLEIAIDQNYISDVLFFNELFLKIINSDYLLTWNPHTIAKTKRIKHPQPTDEEEKKFLNRYRHKIINDYSANPRLDYKLDIFNPAPDVKNNLSTNNKLNIQTVFADTGGCGYYRIIHPSLAINSNELSNIICSQQIPTAYELEKNDINALVCARPFQAHHYEQIKNSTRFSSLYKTAEIDDNFLDIHINHPYYNTHDANEYEKNMRKSLTLFDRLLVSTEELADRYQHLHHNIKVKPNDLPKDWWKDLELCKNKTNKIRIGWAGGDSHKGDLDLLQEIVKIFQNDIDWVFLGLCPKSLEPYVQEIHQGVRIQGYAKKLSSLNLDIALAPLEDNEFNRCKSDLRLLEYGACNFPVICSDIGPYKNSNLPATRVKNKLNEWIDAIESHIKSKSLRDSQASLLHQSVINHRMLDEKNSAAWLDAWSH